MDTNLRTYDLTEFQSNLISGDYDKCYGFVKTILADDVDFKLLYDDVFKKSMYTVGEMWETGKITVATEHLASAIIETILSDVYFKVFTKNKVQKTALLACTENEFHQIGIKMVNDTFENNGWDVQFMGANTTTDEILTNIESLHPDILAISLSIPFNLPTLEQMLLKIRTNYPDQFILIGGQAFLHGGLELLNKFPRIIYKADLNDLNDYLKKEIC